jgi:hypothetical protein
MKITTFDPMIITPNAENVMRVFEDLGFEKTHAPVTTTETGDVASFRMKHEDGYHVDVADLKQIPKDMTYIRMNVDNFEEAYNILIAHGFKNTRGDGTIDTKSATAATMVSPSGFTISLIKHIKDHD